MILRDALPWIFAFSLILFISILENRLLASLILLSLILFVAYFFRDPERHPQGDGYIAPADGRVMRVSERGISIFMGLTDVHVNRSPYDGIVRRVEKIKGSHFPAFLKNSDKNEKNVIILETRHGDLILTQVVGFFARRIVCKVKEGDRVQRGERIGYICFGSRVDVIFPEGTKIYVGEGDKVKAGETVVAVPVDEKNS